jgi:hypothetical protein
MLEAQKDETQFVVTTFRPEILDVADHFILARVEHKCSWITESSFDEVAAVLKEVEAQADRVGLSD